MSSELVVNTDTAADNEIASTADDDKTVKKPEPTVDSGDTNEPLSVFSDESYACDRQYAIVLAQLMSVKERDKVYKWIER